MGEIKSPFPGAEEPVFLENSEHIHWMTSELQAVLLTVLDRPGPGRRKK